MRAAPGAEWRPCLGNLIDTSRKVVWLVANSYTNSAVYPTPASLKTTAGE